MKSDPAIETEDSLGDDHSLIFDRGGDFSVYLPVPKDSRQYVWCSDCEANSTRFHIMSLTESNSGTIQKVPIWS
jgi:hypothetical protein